MTLMTFSAEKNTGVECHIRSLNSREDGAEQSSRDNFAFLMT